MSDADEFLAFAYRTALAAGAAILPHFRETLVIDDKSRGAAYDPVTEADRGAEHAIRAAITGAYPDHGIRGEEHGSQHGSAPYTWVIDPIDGTRSFILGMLHWATLIAVNDGKRVLAGVVHQPYVGETFMASADGPAQWRRGTETRVLTTRHCARISDAVVACTDPKMFTTDAAIAAFHRVADEARLVRYGGDCYAYCLLAMGLVDIVIESSLQAWDVQALIPVIDRAGGAITTWEGKGAHEGGSVIATGDRVLHDRVMEALAAI